LLLATIDGLKKSLTALFHRGIILHLLLQRLKNKNKKYKYNKKKEMIIAVVKDYS